MCKHHSWRKALIFSVNVVLLLCLLSSSLLFSTHSRTASANDSLFYDDFITQAPSASWSSGAGNLPFPGSDSDSRGFALYRDNFQLEDNSTWERALETHPEWVSNGWIMGVYPQMTVPSDAELKVTVGFLKGATGSDGVTFEVWFEELSLQPVIYSIIKHGATYDGELDSITADLSSLEGKTGTFVLYVNAGQAAGRDWAIWAEARIEIALQEFGDLDIISVEPVQVVYGAPLVAGKGTLFRVKVRSTFQVPIETNLKLELPEDYWITSPPRTGNYHIGLPPDWEYPEIWGPVTINPGDNEIMLPIVPDGHGNATWSGEPAGIIRGRCSRGVCGPDVRVVPRPRDPRDISFAPYTVEVDPYKAITETNEYNNEHSYGAAVYVTKPWSFYFVPYHSMAKDCTPDPGDVTDVAKLQLEYLLAMFPIADSKISYAHCPLTMTWEDRKLEGPAQMEGYESRGEFLARVSYLARLEGYDFGVAVKCGGGGATMTGWVGACIIGDNDGDIADVLPHEFNHQVTGMGDIYSYLDCGDECDGRRYCELGTTQDCCPEGYSRTECEDWCVNNLTGHPYGCPDRRNVVPATDGFWVNRWIPISSQTSHYFMDLNGCIDPANCSRWTWMRLEDVRDCIDTGECGHRLPDGTIVWGDMGTANHAGGISNDGYLNLLASTGRFRSELDPEALLVGGTISKNGTAIFDPFIYLPDATLDILPDLEGDFYLVLLDENGSVLSTSGFEVQFYQTDPDGGPVDEAPFVYRIEWKEGTKRIELQDKDGNILASRQVSSNKPEIRVLYPNGGEVFAVNETVEMGWQASDEDGDALTYTLSISLDSGETWLPVDIGMTDNEYEIGAEALEEGQDYLIKVRATDGVNTSEDVSDGVFTITGREAEGGPSGLCFIATATYGTPMAEEIEILREFRDEYLLANPVGEALVDVYYRVSPPIAGFITEHPILKPLVRTGLLPAVAMSAVAVNTSPAEKMAIVGSLVLVSVALAVWATRRRGRGPEYT